MQFCAAPLGYMTFVGSKPLGVAAILKLRISIKNEPNFNNLVEQVSIFEAYALPMIFQ